MLQKAHQMKNYIMEIWFGTKYTINLLVLSGLQGLFTFPRFTQIFAVQYCVSAHQIGRDVVAVAAAAASNLALLAASSSDAASVLSSSELE